MSKNNTWKSPVQDQKKLLCMARPWQAELSTFVWKPKKQALKLFLWDGKELFICVWEEIVVRMWPDCEKFHLESGQFWKNFQDFKSSWKQDLSVYCKNPSEETQWNHGSIIQGKGTNITYLGKGTLFLWAPRHQDYPFQLFHGQLEVLRNQQCHTPHLSAFIAPNRSEIWVLTLDIIHAFISQHTINTSCHVLCSAGMADNIAATHFHSSLAVSEHSLILPDFWNTEELLNSNHYYSISISLNKCSE